MNTYNSIADEYQRILIVLKNFPFYATVTDPILEL